MQHRAVNLPRKAVHAPEAIHHHEKPKKQNKNSRRLQFTAAHRKHTAQTPQRFRCPFIAPSPVPRRIALSGPRTGWAAVLPDVHHQRKQSKIHPPYRRMRGAANETVAERQAEAICQALLHVETKIRRHFHRTKTSPGLQTAKNHRQ